jgi:hypothetical protein
MRAMLRMKKLPASPQSDRPNPFKFAFSSDHIHCWSSQLLRGLQR